MSNPEKSQSFNELFSRYTYIDPRTGEKVTGFGKVYGEQSFNNQPINPIDPADEKLTLRFVRSPQERKEAPAELDEE